MNQAKCYNLIFKEKEALPIEREFMNEQSKQTYSLPLTDKQSSICYHLSSTQKQILAKEVNKAKKIYEISNSLQDHQALAQTQNNILQVSRKILQETMKLRENRPVTDYIPSRVYGSESLVESNADFNFDQANELNWIHERQNNADTAIAVLLYSGEIYHNLKRTENYFSNMKIYTITLINGKTDFFKLMKSAPLSFKDIYQEKYLKFENFYSTSSSHAMIFEIENNGCYIVFPQQLQYIQLVKWIYLGIGKYVDPQFLIVVSSNQKFTISDGEFQKILTYCGKDNNTKTFGVQWIEKNKSFQSGFLKLINFIDYGATPVSVDGLFTIKQFHNPLSCIYNWQSISPHITTYFTQLYQKQLENDVGLSVNSILPVLMYETQQMVLCQLAESISEQSVDHYQSFDIFQKIGHKNYSIQQQLNEGISMQKQAITAGLGIMLFFQSLISKIFYFEKYFAFSMCLFFAFQCPYQLLYYLLDQQKGYTALSVILPTLYILNVLMFLLISFLYKLEDKIVLRQEKPENVVLSLKIAGNMVRPIFNVEQKYECYSVVTDNQLQVDVVKDNLIKKFQTKIKEQPAYCKINVSTPQYLQIQIIYELLKTNQNILDFIVAFATIVNLIVIYGQNFISDVTIYELLVIIIAIVGVGIFMLVSCLRGKCCNPLNLFLILINFSIINFLSTFYSQTLKVAAPEIQARKKQQLALQLFLNFIALYAQKYFNFSFIAIESYFNYSGYILLGIIGYLVFMQFLPYFLLIIKHCCDPNYKKLNGVEFQNQQQYIDQDLTLDDTIIDQSLQESKSLIFNMQLFCTAGKIQNNQNQQPEQQEKVEGQNHQPNKFRYENMVQQGDQEQQLQQQFQQSKKIQPSASEIPKQTGSQHPNEQFQARPHTSLNQQFNKDFMESQHIKKDSSRK